MLPSCCLLPIAYYLLPICSCLCLCLCPWRRPSLRSSVCPRLEPRFGLCHGQRQRQMGNRQQAIDNIRLLIICRALTYLFFTCFPGWDALQKHPGRGALHSCQIWARGDSRQPRPHISYLHVFFLNGQFHIRCSLPVPTERSVSGLNRLLWHRCSWNGVGFDARQTFYASRRISRFVEWAFHIILVELKDGGFKGPLRAPLWSLRVLKCIGRSF